jgi:predicted enzyme related to lactoylglutathione lyase
MGDAVVHFEIAGPDHEGTAKFFAELFGWEVLRSIPEMFYTTIDTRAGSGVNGGFGSPPDTAPYVTVYAAVDDLQATLDKAESLGAKTLMGITEVPGIVTMAMIADPAGNAFGLIKNEGEAVLPSAGDGKAVDWFEILGPDGNALKSFYGDLLGWSFQDAPGDGFAYFMVDTGAGRGINGGVGQSQDGNPQVNVYAHVDDLQKYVEVAESNGGSTLVPPMEVMESLSIAQIASPSGARFGLYVGM